MFKKLVSNLPFSPTLIGELGFYAKRLRKEETTRRLGVILTVLALIVQSLGVFSPPESANASNLSDLIPGGIHSKSELIKAWDENRHGFRDLLEHADINRQNLEQVQSSHMTTRTNGQDNGWLNWSRVTRGGTKYNESSFHVKNQKIYIRSLSAFDTGKFTTGKGSSYPAFIGVNSKGEQFAIMKGCANIAMKKRFTDKKIQVCDINTRTIVTIRERNFDQSKHSQNTSDCQPQPIEVCDTSNRTIVSIDQKDFDQNKHSKNLADCQPQPIEVCDLSTTTMITIDKRDFNQSQHSKNPADCQPKPEPIANCSSLMVKKLTRTEVELQASANIKNGATIKSYTYVIKNSSGKEVFRQTVSSGATSNRLATTLAEGNYTAEVIVSTSLGNKTSSACQENINIEQIKRCPLNPDLAINDPNCQPCPGDSTIWVKDSECAAQVISSKQATNLSSGQPADQTVAKTSDRIEYVLTVRNDGKDEATMNIEDNLSDVLEYGHLYDRGGGVLNEETKVLLWENIRLQPGEEQKRSYVVRVASTISPMPRGSSDPSSYDCRMVNVFGNTIEVDVECPGPKVIEQVVPELPRTGPGANMIVGSLVAAVVVFLYLRSKQLNKEVRLIRREAVAGTI